MCLPLQPPPHRFEGLLGGIPGLERLRSLQPDVVLAPMDGVKPLGHWDMGTQKRHLLPGSWPHRLERGSRQGGGEERRARGGRGSGQSTLLSSPVWPRLPMSGLGSVISLCSTGKAPRCEGSGQGHTASPHRTGPRAGCGRGLRTKCFAACLYPAPEKPVRATDKRPGGWDPGFSLHQARLRCSPGHDADSGSSVFSRGGVQWAVGQPLDAQWPRAFLGHPFPAPGLLGEGAAGSFRLFSATGSHNSQREPGANGGFS